MSTLLLVFSAVLFGLMLAAILLPRQVEYVETIEIASPASDVHDAIRYQSKLMKWSAWPEETGSTCHVEGPDGKVGAQTVFTTKAGKRFGYQEVTHIDPNRSVTLILDSKGSPHKPVMTLFTVPSEAETTRVLLHFVNDIMPPFHLLQRLFGIVRWTRRMHQKDLQGLKQFCEAGQ